MLHIHRYQISKIIVITIANLYNYKAWILLSKDVVVHVHVLRNTIHALPFFLSSMCGICLEVAA